MLGDFEVTALNDGGVPYSTKQVLPTATPQQIRRGLAESGLTDSEDMSYNTFLINTASPGRDCEGAISQFHTIHSCVPIDAHTRSS